MTDLEHALAQIDERIAENRDDVKRYKGDPWFDEAYVGGVIDGLKMAQDALLSLIKENKNETI